MKIQKINFIKSSAFNTKYQIDKINNPFFLSHVRFSKLNDDNFNLINYFNDPYSIPYCNPPLTTANIYSSS